MHGSRWIVVVAGLLGACGMALAAFQAHGLAEWLNDTEANVIKRVDWCGTAVRFHLVHVLALLGVAWLAQQSGRFWGNTTAILMLLGMAGFSGGLYEMAFRGEPTHPLIVPSGGLLLILAWVSVAICGWKMKTEPVG